MLKTINMKQPANIAESSIVLAIENNESSDFIKGLTEAFYIAGMINNLQHGELVSYTFQLTLQGR